MKALKMFRSVAVAACLACAGMVAVSMVPSEVLAQDTDVITMEFLGFSTVDPDYYAFVQGSKMAGKTLVVNKIGSDKSILVYPLQGTTLSKAMNSPKVREFGFTPNGHVAGMVAPAGYQLGGMVLGGDLQLTLSAGGQSMKLGDAKIFTDPTGTKMAEVSIKNAFWTPDSKRLVVILNQKLGGDWAVDTDMIAAFTLG